MRLCIACMLINYYCTCIYIHADRTADMTESVQWISELELLTTDRACLQPGAWLNDKIIHAAQTILKNQYPGVGGLLSSLY